MKGLGEVSGADAGMAYLLWVLVFPIVWATLSENKEQQVQLAKPIIALLSRQSNPRQAAARPNVVQVGAASIQHAQQWLHRSPCKISMLSVWGAWIAKA